MGPWLFGLYVMLTRFANMKLTPMESSTLLMPSENMTWPLRYVAKIEGQLILGGLMMIHERENKVICGPVMPQGGVQALETMLYTIDYINKNETFLPGIRIGAHILDDCDKDTYGLEQAVDFIKGSINKIDEGDYKCPDGSNPIIRHQVISGVVGAPSSVTSIQVANLLRLFKIPQVSFFSTSPELSNKVRFEYFSRTIPSDYYQVKAMVEILKELKWTYISVLYEESNYGIKGFEELERLLGLKNICIAVKEKLVKDSGVAGKQAYDDIVRKLLSKNNARGVIIFGSDQEVSEVMKAVRRQNASDHFAWIGSDGWSARALVSEHNKREVEGTLSVQPQANPVAGFDEYFLGLTVENNKRNPWFTEFWEDHFKCRYPGSPQTPYNGNYSRKCTGREKMTRNDTEFEAQLQFVSDSVMAFAYAFSNMHTDLCKSQKGICAEMETISGEELLKYLRKVNFRGLSGDTFKFDQQGDGPARYNIIHFKQVRPGEYKWITVGKYEDEELKLQMSDIAFKMNLQKELPSSVCSLPCEVGQIVQYVDGEVCCWHCYNCSSYQIVDQSDKTKCYTCPEGRLPNENKTMCYALPEVYLSPASGWAIGALTFASFGVLLTGFIVTVFVLHNNTPVVRASGRELSYVLLSGILLCYASTFVLILRPTNFVCGLQKFLIGFCFAVVYGALLTKTNRIARIFNAGKKTTKRPSFISPQSQLVICGVIVSIQVIITALWMFVSPPEAIHYFPTRKDNLLVCKASIDASYMIAFTYPILLIIICTIYAILTRKIPEAFNESKHIGFTMYTTCIIWLAFVPIYFSTSNHVDLRITTMCVSICLSATVAVVCLFSPKLYIILLHPERNVRQSMMPTTKYSAVRNNVSSSSQLRVDSATQSENLEMLEKYRVVIRVASSTQTSPAYCHIRHRSSQTTREMCAKLMQAATPHKVHKQVVKNGPIQDIPDIQL